MGRLSGFKYRQIIRKLKKLGFEFDRQDDACDLEKEMKNLLLASLTILIITGCTGTPEKSFVYQLDGVGQVSCNRGAEESALQQAANVISTLGKAGANILTIIPNGEEESSKINSETLNALIANMQVETKMKTLETAFEVCKKMNGMKRNR